MSSPQVKATMRMAVGSFVAGAGAMMLVGFVAPVAMQGGLAMRDAVAMQMEVRTDAIEPIDVAAIEAQLDAADARMEAMRQTTADEINQLDRLAGR